MDHKQQEQVALHRWAVIAEAASRRPHPRPRQPRPQHLLNLDH
jgi:hypothetical protein